METTTELMSGAWGKFLINIILSLAGLAVYSLWKIRKKIKVFDAKVFLADNKGFWIWAMALQTIFALLIAFAPNAPEAINNIIGLDYSQSMAFFSTGYALGGLANGATEDKIGTPKSKQS